MAVVTPAARAATEEDKELLISGSEAVAEALTLADLDVVTAYPIRPYDTVMQAIAKKISGGRRLPHALPGADDGAAEVEGRPVPAPLRPRRSPAASRQPDHRRAPGERGLGHRDPTPEQRGDGARRHRDRRGVRGLPPGLRPRSGQSVVRGVHDR